MVYASATYFVDNGFGEMTDNLTALLERASRIMRAECLRYGTDLDQRIADGTLDEDLVADVACDMAAYALASPGSIGIESIQQGAGPYQETVKYVNPVGQLSFTKVHRRRLGVGPRAWEIDLLGDRS